MKKWIGKLVLIPAVAGVLLVTAGVVVVLDTVPSMPAPPLAPVVGMPQATVPSAPYSGQHPRLLERPEETFTFPIALGEAGPVESLFSGPPQYPFFCGRDRSRADDAQPLIDNQDGMGVPVFASYGGELDTDTVIGYSKDCSYPVQVRYYYQRQGSGQFFPLEEADDDIAVITVDGRDVEYVVRLETGTINRFIYAIAVLKGENESAQSPSPTNWNGRLIYQFRGGVGIGRRQGDFSLSHVLNDRAGELQQGYAVVYSTANQSRNHFNVQLAEDTAWRVKRQFTALYGEPVYTVGVGGSGGAIQQYLFAQNAPGLLDAAIALYAYPDVVTQTIHVQDCELLEYFMDETDRGNHQWRTWENRTLLQGMSADSTARNRFAPAQNAAMLLTGNWSRLRGLRGSTACVSGWRGLTPLMTNPAFTDREDDYHPDVLQAVNWTYWDDLAYIFGQDAQGYANMTWDNVGVQYGLDALVNGDISPETFISLNREVGGWKASAAMEPEKFWFLNGGIWPVSLTFYSDHNMQRAPASGTVAPRTNGSTEAMRAAWLSGQVFAGVADIPIIDARHYLDDQLDMHHLQASFSARARMERTMGHADNQLIWVTAEPHDPQPQAFAVIERWMQERLANPELSAAQTRPGDATDRCYNQSGQLLAEGRAVWDGVWNGRTTGACADLYPQYRTSRQVAGDGATADVFRCHLQPVSTAITSGVYGDVDMRQYQTELEVIHPDGVCDYSQGDSALPAGLLESLRATVQ